MKKLKPSEMYERLDKAVEDEKLFEWMQIRTNKYSIRYTEDGKVYTFNCPLYELVHKLKLISSSEYYLFIEKDDRINKDGLNK